MRKTLLILSLLLCPVLAFANTTRGTLVGIVLNAKHQPVAAARVFLQSADGSAPHALRADAQGHFRIPSLRAGLYDVRAEAGGISSEWNHNVVVRDGKEAEISLLLVRRSLPARTHSSP